jgi:hypothetical protein
MPEGKMNGQLKSHHSSPRTKEQAEDEDRRTWENE